MQKPCLYVKPKDNQRKQIAIFTVPKPFSGHIGIIQRNAIRSWALLQSNPKIILFGNEAGTDTIAQELGLQHIPHVKRNQFGTPLLHEIFAEVQQLVETELIAYVNADIILMDDFIAAIQTTAEHLETFLMIGRRWDVELLEPLKFQGNWQAVVQQKVRDIGCLATPDAKDYFVFPKGLFAEIPPFAVGRGYWDTWMVATAIDRLYPVVDASQVVVAVHQEHDYAHVQGGKNEAYMGAEAQHNKSLGRVNRSHTIADSTIQLKPWHLNNAPEVSVIITAHNRAATLPQAIDSVLNQGGVRCEAIVVDDGSTDDTPAILQAYQTQIRAIHQPQQGILAARNQGLKIAQGEFVTFLEADSILLPGVLKQLIDVFEARSSVLDIVLSGWQVAAKEPISSVEPWQILPDLEDLHVWKLAQIWQPLAQSRLTMRRSQLIPLKGFNQEFSLNAAQIEMVLTLSVLRGAKATWIKTVTHCCFLDSEDDYQEPKPLTPETVTEMKKVLDYFFDRPELRDWMKPLKPVAYRTLNVQHNDRKPNQ